MIEALVMVGRWCPQCRLFSPPTRDQAWHEATRSHKENVREPERRVRAGTRAERGSER